MSQCTIHCNEPIHVENLKQALQSINISGEPKFKIACEDEVFQVSNILSIFSPVLSSLYNSNIETRTLIIPDTRACALKLLTTLLIDGSVKLHPKDLLNLDSLLNVARSLGINVKNVETLILEEFNDKNEAINFNYSGSIKIVKTKIAEPSEICEVTQKQRINSYSLVESDSECVVAESDQKTNIDQFHKHESKSISIKVANVAKVDQQMKHIISSKLEIENVLDDVMKESSTDEYKEISTYEKTKPLALDKASTDAVSDKSNDSWHWDVDCKVYIGGLPKVGADVVKQELNDRFCSIGKVKYVWVCRGPYSAGTNGFAFVEMGSPSEAKEAVRAFDGTRMCGFNVKVKMSNGGKEGTMVQGRDGYWGIGKTDEESRVRRSKERGRRRSIDRSSSSESESTDERLSSSKNKSKSYKSKRLHRKRRSRSRSRS